MAELIAADDKERATDEDVPALPEEGVVEDAEPVPCAGVVEPPVPKKKRHKRLPWRTGLCVAALLTGAAYVLMTDPGLVARLLARTAPVEIKETDLPLPPKEPAERKPAAPAPAPPSPLFAPTRKGVTSERLNIMAEAAKAPPPPVAETPLLGETDAERRLREKESAIYDLKDALREARAEAAHAVRERDAAIGAAAALQLIHAFQAETDSGKRAALLKHIAEFVPEIDAAAGAPDMKAEFDLLYREIDRKERQVLSWEFLPEFLRPHARRWLYVEKTAPHPLANVRNALEADDPVALETAMQAVDTAAYPEFAAWAERYAAKRRLDKAVNAAATKLERRLSAAGERTEGEGR
jgi:hypothetical protein